jgi:hypothetical protein
VPALSGAAGRRSVGSEVVRDRNEHVSEHARVLRSAAGLPRRRPARGARGEAEAEPVGHADEVRKRAGSHLLHHAGTLHSARACARGQSWTRPCLMAKWVSSAVVWSPSVCISWNLWNSTVLGEISRVEAISFVERPSATSWRT